MAEILAVKSLSGGGVVVVGGFQSIAWSQPQSGLAVTICVEFKPPRRLLLGTAECTQLSD